MSLILINNIYSTIIISNNFIIKNALVQISVLFLLIFYKILLIKKIGSK